MASLTVGTRRARHKHRPLVMWRQSSKLLPAELHEDHAHHITLDKVQAKSVAATAQLMLAILFMCRKTCCIQGVPGGIRRMLKYTNITQSTYIQSWTVTEIMTREKCGLLAVQRTVLVKLTCYLYTAHVRPWEWNAVTFRVRYERLVTCTELQKCVPKTA